MISPVIAWIILLTNDVVQLLYGNSFASAAKALTVLACAMLFTVPATLFYSTFAALGKQKTFMYITVFILMVKTILDRILIPSYAEIGTAYATIVTEFIMLFMCIVILHLSKITMEIFTIYGKAWMCVGFSMLIMMPFMMGSTLVIKVTASLLYYAIYLMMVFITGLFKIADVKILFKKI
jgi:O-antigen/teichoic acid export membrane protein